MTIWNNISNNSKKIKQCCICKLVPTYHFLLHCDILSAFIYLIVNQNLLVTKTCTRMMKVLTFIRQKVLPALGFKSQKQMLSNFSKISLK